MYVFEGTQIRKSVVMLINAKIASLRDAKRFAKTKTEVGRLNEAERELTALAHDIAEATVKLDENETLNW